MNSQLVAFPRHQVRLDNNGLPCLGGIKPGIWGGRSQSTGFVTKMNIQRVPMGWSGLVCINQISLPVPCWGCVSEAHRCIQEGNVGHPEELLSRRTVICFVKNRLIGRRRSGTSAAAPVPWPALRHQLWNFSALGWDWGNSAWKGSFIKSWEMGGVQDTARGSLRGAGRA